MEMVHVSFKYKGAIAIYRWPKQNRTYAKIKSYIKMCYHGATDISIVTYKPQAKTGDDSK